MFGLPGFFFFKQKTAYEMRISDWSSDVCSSDLGEGAFNGGVDSAEIQALYSRAINPYWNVQAGVRHDFQPNPSRTYATIGIEGLAPYWFEVEGALFLSDKGDVLARAEEIGRATCRERVCQYVEISGFV